MIEIVRRACNNKGYYVVDADIEKFFDNVNDTDTTKNIGQKDTKANPSMAKSRGPVWKYPEISEFGTSQGSVISPLLANIYLHTLDRLWKKYGHKYGKLVRYADDTIIICKN